MRIIFSFLSLICVFLLAAGCAQSGGSRVSSRHASEKAIMTAMGQGLLGPVSVSMGRDERRSALEAEYRSLEYAGAGMAVTWRADNGAAFGSVTPGQPYRVGSQNCRQYSHSFSVNGIPHTMRGSACRNPDGSWTPLT